MIGAGRYDDLCEDARIATKAKGVVLIIGDGKNGNGWSLVGQKWFLLEAPTLLRKLADEIEKDIKDLGLVPS